METPSSASRSSAEGDSNPGLNPGLGPRVVQLNEFRRQLVEISRGKQPIRGKVLAVDPVSTR